MAKLELEIIKNAGIVGAGGAGFPTYVKLDAQVDLLIINGAECEPLIHVDRQLLGQYFERIYDGIRIAAKLTGAKRIILALKAKYKDTIKVIEDFKNQNEKTSDLKFELFKLGNFYPAGDEQVLVYEVTGKVVPEGGIPLQVGIVVINVETLLNISNALNGENVIRKFVTVNGEVGKPLTIKVPVGTPIRKLIDFCGGITVSEYAVLDGGPMMGKLVDLNTYAVKKTTKSIIVLPDSSIVIEHKKRIIKKAIKRAQAICLSCRMCTDLCPRYLLGHDIFPDEMMKKMYRGELTDEDLEKYDFAFMCCDCGVCELYSCVVDLSARSLFNYIKDELTKKGIKNPHTRYDITANEFRQYRKVPVDRLEKRLEIDRYNSKAPLADFNAGIGEIKLYLSQHIGAPSIPVIQPGMIVKEGDLVADIPEGKIGSRIHSSINGIVSEVNEAYISVRESKNA